MSPGVLPLLAAQFLSAFGDNAILFVIVAIVLQDSQAPAWYIPALQSSFLAAYVISAPWVGPFADSRSKPGVLIIGNLFKAAGVGLILLQIEPIAAYALVGLGAAIYSPAKYGILPELVTPTELVTANSWIEASTIAAIVLGTLAGGQLADLSITGALWMVVGTYLVSVAVTFAIPKLKAHGATLKGALGEFAQVTREFLTTPRARFSMLGGSLFWGSSAVLRVVLVAWAPLVLAMDTAGDISILTLFLAIGVIVGAAVVPKLITLKTLRRARIAAYAMGLLILLFGTVETIWPARAALFLIGIAGGMFVIPINAALQEIGHAGIGSGHAIAIQNFFQNLAMLLMVGLYTAAAAGGIGPVETILALGAFIVMVTILISRRLPPGDPYQNNNTE
jgi:LPLT family lysophospholipid transporter-like MFS transporter